MVLKQKLTAAYVKSVRRPGKHYDGMHGLYLFVDKSGAKRWVQRLSIQGKTIEMGLGSALLYSLAETREKALENRRIARSGGNPLSEKRAASAVLTFEETAYQVWELKKPNWKNPKHAQQWINTLSQYVFPKFGRKKVSEVDGVDVMSVLTPIWNEKTQTAQRVKQRVNSVMQFAKAQGWRIDNPVDAVSEALPMQNHKVQHRKALPYEQIGELLLMVEDSKAMQISKLALEFVILTATRSSETRLAEWSEVDFDKAEWLIPEARMKASVQHRVPLCKRALDVLRDAQTINGNRKLIFEGKKSGRPVSENTMNKLMRDNDFVFDTHGFRTTFRTWGQEQTRFSNDALELALAHTERNKVKAAYARSDLFEERRKIMDAWCEYVMSEKARVSR